MALKRTMVNGIVNRIRLVGVELEGGWDTRPDGMGVDHEGIEHDGSVVFGMASHPLLAPVRFTVEEVRDILHHLSNTVPEVTAPDEVERLSNAYKQIHIVPPYRGEIVLHKPQPPGSAELEEWIRRCYPKYVNDTCGLHVHMSFFNRLNYQRLMTPVYTETVVENLKRWAENEKLSQDHPLWPRLLQPNHRHCAHVYLGDGQVKIRRKDYNSRGTPFSRYTAINYCDKQHGTVECRLLSMMENADQAVRAVNAVINTTNRFLSKFREREVKVRATVPQKSEVFMAFPGIVDGGSI